MAVSFCKSSRDHGSSLHPDFAGPEFDFFLGHLANSRTRRSDIAQLRPCWPLPHAQIIGPFAHVPTFFVAQLDGVISETVAMRGRLGHVEGCVRKAGGMVVHGPAPELLDETRYGRLFALMGDPAYPFDIARPRVGATFATDDSPMKQIPENGTASTYWICIAPIASLAADDTGF